MTAVIHDARICELGEGPMWHPLRNQLFWVDIVGKRLLSREGDRPLEWTFDRWISACGWIDRDWLFIATETGLIRFNVETGAQIPVAALAEQGAMMRSNDGRADPHGGFWFGTMAHDFEPGAGAIHRYHEGRLEKLYDEITVANSICFDPGGRIAYWTDTITRQIMRQNLDTQGWPEGAPEVFVDLREAGRNPDGAVVDSEGGLWSAHWNASQVVRYRPDGTFDRALEVPGRLVTCPEFGGPDFATLYVTTARMGMRAPKPADGLLYAFEPGVRGLAQYRVQV